VGYGSADLRRQQNSFFPAQPRRKKIEKKNREEVGWGRGIFGFQLIQEN
jgi:hypothetical protein